MFRVDAWRIFSVLGGMICFGATFSLVLEDLFQRLAWVLIYSFFR